MQSHNDSLDGDRTELIRRVVRENPLFASALGLCPALAVSYRVDNAIAMGGAVFVVLLFSNTTYSLVEGRIPRRFRFIARLFIASVFTTVVELLFRAYAPQLLERLGIYVPIIAVNCLVLAESRGARDGDRMLDAIRNGTREGLGFFLALLGIAIIREIVGRGTITLFSMGGFDGVIRLGGLADHPVSVVAYSAGALMILGYLQALFVWTVQRERKKEA